MDPNQHQHIDDGDECLAGDLLKGADKIRDFLIRLGMPAKTDPYYLKRTKRWPIGGDGGSLLASKRRLTRHIEKITRGPTAA